MTFRPPLFLLTGLGWLMLSAFLGLALYLGMILGYPLPPFLRLLHVHAALVGGVAQMILGALLAFIPPLLMGRERPASHPVLYALVNLGAVWLLIGFGVGRYSIVATGGALVALAFLSLIGDAWRQVRASLIAPPLNLWFYGMALLALLLGLAAGEVMALWPLRPQGIVGPARLAHIHLNLLGFVTLTIVGPMHTLFPTVLNSRLHSARLAFVTFALLPAGILVLVAGLFLSQIPVQLAGGAAILAGAALYAANILKTWLDAGRPRTASAEHFLVATLFLVLSVIAGVLVSVNHLWEPSRVPFGTLHLVAYTHLALVGFVLQTIFGALTHLLPVMLATSRVRSNKKRGPYLAELTGIVERWRPFQVGMLSLGTMGLALVASLVWQFHLRSSPVQSAAWASAALLAAALLLFSVTVVRLLGRRPPERSHIPD